MSGQCLEPTSFELNKNDQIIDLICQSKRIPNAMLFYGPDLNLSFGSMVKVVQQLNHVDQSIDCAGSDGLQEPIFDVLLLNPEGNSIKIEMVKLIQNRIKYGASGEGYCFVMIHFIDRLTLSAGNALLKLIEEPPPKTKFLFSSQNKDRVLATIRSRSQQVHVALAPTELIKQRKNNNQLNNHPHYIGVAEFLTLTELDQLCYIQKLPYDTDFIAALLMDWKFDLFCRLDELTSKELVFLEKMIEIISNMKYNFNLKLQLLSVTFEL